MSQAAFTLDAYGITPDLPDPVENAIYSLLEHIHAQDRELEALARAVERLGGTVEKVALPELDGAALDKKDENAVKSE